MSRLEEAGMKIAADREKMTCTLINFRSASDDALTALHPDPGFTREMAKVLERRHLNVFSNAGDLQRGTNCTTVGSYPDLYYQLFGYKEKATHLISGIRSPWFFQVSTLVTRYEDTGRIYE